MFNNDRPLEKAQAAFSISTKDKAGKEVRSCLHSRHKRSEREIEPGTPKLGASGLGYPEAQLAWAELVSREPQEDTLAVLPSSMTVMPVSLLVKLHLLSHSVGGAWVRKPSQQGSQGTAEVGEDRVG